MNKINRMISNYNYNPGNISRIKYIVIHYVGALGGAQENCAYYGGGNRGASAHYFVGFAGEIWQCVEDRNIAFFFQLSLDLKALWGEQLQTSGMQKR